MQAASLEQGGNLMVKKSGTKSARKTKKVKSLAPSAKKAKGVRGGSFSFGIKSQTPKVYRPEGWI
jgi:hypothetical protein